MGNGAEHLLVFSIGPVQGFISAARRGRDLWFSSWLLSEIARAAGREVCDHLVMPTAGMVEDGDAAVSNKLLLHLRGQDPAAVAAAMEGAARAKLREIRGQLLAGVDSSLVDVARAAEQIDDLPEFAWASADVRDGRDYGQARQLAESLLAARKGCKPFVSPSWAGAVPKSSLDGERETVLRASSRERREEPIRTGLRRLGIGEAEHLCGVGLLKRLGHRVAEGHPGGRVQSTSHVASWSLRRCFQEAGPFQERCRAAFVAYEERLRGLGAELSRTPGAVPVLGRRDGHILYESRLQDLFPKGARREIEEARRALRALFSAWREAAREHAVALPTLTPYYAVLLADGDRMGVAIDAIREPGAHRAVTGALEAFARGARGVIEGHHGHCVYSGGDDVLALLPVHEAIGCAAALQQSFGPVADAFAAVGAPRPSLSVGLSVAHHVDPFQDALEGARAAERYAKQDMGRDAWAVRVDKRGGAPVTAGGKWERLPWLVLDIEAMVRLGLPRGLPHEIAALATRTPGEALKEVRRAELRRVLAQKSLDPCMFCDRLGEEVDLDALARRLVVARSLSGMEGERD